MKSVVLLVVLCAVAAFARPLSERFLNGPAISQETIDRINENPESTWTAGFNRKFRNMRLADVQQFLGARLNGPKLPELKKHRNVDLPEEYDVRDEWAVKCPSTAEVRDQSRCGSCWAFGAAESMTDRICIASNGKARTHVSAAHLVACCWNCGNGCQGGYPASAWSYWENDGLVSGGNYSDAEVDNGCYPYPFPPCEHHSNGTQYQSCDALPEEETPACPNQCDEHSTEDWKTDRTYGESSYSVSGEENIMAELKEHGSLEVAFQVYEDFVTYKSGVYHHTHSGGRYLGGHAVKLIGWGVEGGVKYWTIMNSWNSDWGDNGQFKILRGVDECGIEDDVVGGIPKRFW